MDHDGYESSEDTEHDNDLIDGGDVDLAAQCSPTRSANCSPGPNWHTVDCSHLLPDAASAS